jgi:hypothetical protein
MGRKGEAEFLSRLNIDQELERRTAVLCANLTHVVPTLADVPIETVLRIRRNDHEGFVDYRNTIREVIRGHLNTGGNISEIDAQQIHQDVLRPRVERLMNETKKQREYDRKSSTVSLAVPVALLSIGILGGALPTHMAEFLKISGTLGRANEAIKALVAAITTRSGPGSNSLSFLLELDKSSPAGH